MDSAKTRNKAYKKKLKLVKRQTRPGRYERVKQIAQRSREEVDKLTEQTAILKQEKTRLTKDYKTLKRKLQESELTNILLKDPASRSNRLRRLGLSATKATSGHVSISESSPQLVSFIKVFNKDDLCGNGKIIGKGRFGICYHHILGHFNVCLKMFHVIDNSSFCEEANILSRFCHPNLPHLFGVCRVPHPGIIMNFHGIDDNTSVTLHTALGPADAIEPSVHSKLASINWLDIINQILTGVQYMHRCRILHNDLKTDNIVLGESAISATLVPMIVDFGKACDIINARQYRLTSKQRERYKKFHPQIAPDLRDGRCKQSAASDIYSLGRIFSIINDFKTLDLEGIQHIIQQCLQYSSHSRPTLESIQSCIQHNI